MHTPTQENPLVTNVVMPEGYSKAGHNLNLMIGWVEEQREKALQGIADKFRYAFKTIFGKKEIIPKSSDTAILLLEHAKLMNTFGIHSAEVNAFIELHKDDKEFMELNPILTKLKEKIGIRHS